MNLEGYEVLKVVAQYKIYKEGTPPDMYIEVYQDNGVFLAQCNYSFWSKEQIDPYQHDLRGQCSEIEAVSSVLRAWEQFWKPTLAPTEYSWAYRNNYELVVRGDGKTMTRAEFKKAK
ncbi:MAG: hypothetical protein LBP19_01255 [Treponema sp.]|jgi:hypothetical protein|nr:hypothetical protein [Treponema sp.]